MTNSTSRLLVAAALLLVPSLAIAQNLTGREGVIARIAVADLDLSSQAGKASFDHRLRHAIRVVCGDAPGNIALNERIEQDRCRSQVRSQAIAAAKSYHAARLAGL